MRKVLFILFCVISIKVSAQVTDTSKKPHADTTLKKLADTVKKDLLSAPDTVQHLHSKIAALIPPAAMVSYGILSFVVHPIRHFDYYINNDFNKYYPRYPGSIENYFQYGAVATVYALNLLGDEGKNRFIDRTALLGLSAVYMGGSTFAIKGISHRLRPNKANYYSFPSGHTANAFMGAEFLAQEYSGKSPWYGVFGYTLAGVTGVLRMYHRDHWFSDVVAGAGFGILSTKLAYLTYPYIRNYLTYTTKDGKKSTMVIPMYQDGVKGVSIAMTL